ncbi:hypothetical protein TWF128_004499 [Orbilia oligospora]|nr:hypothetical protein TWF128_004499 [Orbilia oligospora]
MSEQETIREATIASRETLQRCLEIPRLTRNGWAENRLLDFNLWCAGAGVFADGKLSFDHRLAPKPEIRGSIIDLLLLLNIFVEGCIEKAQVFRVDRNNLGSKDQQKLQNLDEGNPCGIELSTDELEGRKDVELVLNRIITLTVAIRSAGSKTRFQRADKSFNPQDAKMENLRRILELVIHPRGLKPDGVVDAIQLRLINANLQRRHRFNYAKVHSINLAGPPSEKRAKTARETGTRQASQKPAVGVPANIPSEEANRPAAPSPSIIAPTSITAASAIESTVSIKVLKQLRALSTTPCERYSPYTCVLSGCAQSLQLFLTRKDWEHHLNVEHGQYWNCFICEQLGKSDNHEFWDEASISYHLRTTHGETIDIGEIPMLIDASHQSKLPETIPCPLCPGPTDDEDSINHLAHCIHDFSLRSLPSPTESCGPGDYFGNGSEGEGTSSQNRIASSERSEKDLEGFSMLNYETSLTTDLNCSGPTKHLLKELSQSLSETLEGSVRKWVEDISFEEDKTSAFRLRPRSFICPKCGAAFALETNLTRHINSRACEEQVGFNEGEIIKEYPCPIDGCPTTLRRGKDNLAVHLKKIHDLKIEVAR